MSRKMLAGLTLGAAAMMLAMGVSTAQGQDAAPPKNDYSDKANWLCWPGRDDACANDNTTTVVRADGSTEVETWKADPNAPVDCFYVYPTVSMDPGVISDMTAGDEERRVVEQQLARFGAKCRVFAPLYRQFTLTALRTAMTSGAPPAAGPRPQTGYTDVVDAWNWYLANENKGRGVVLIGHSQGSGVLTQLIAEHIDGKPVQKQLISAMLLGTNLPVEKGKDVGTFKSIPLCKAPDQTGCAIAYASFRDTVPPPADTRFGRPREPGSNMEAACVNPASLSGGKGELKAYLAAGRTMISGQGAPVWVKGKTVETPFVATPGLLTAECVNKDGFNYLSVHIDADPADPRTDDIAGDVPGADGKPNAGWGLHLIDVNLAMGNLVDLVESQSKAWLARNKG
jgi:pimeloyl-ACP methyl ester carboxylesterase